MTKRTIPDDELIAVADVVTVWVATQGAPTDFWSLAEAVAWVMRQPDRARITLLRPPDKNSRAAWLNPVQIERLAFALAPEPASTAA
jgi:hypothetical protein